MIIVTPCFFWKLEHFDSNIKHLQILLVEVFNKPNFLNLKKSKRVRVESHMEQEFFKTDKIKISYLAIDFRDITDQTIS